MLSLQESLQKSLRDWRIEKKTDVDIDLVGVFCFPDDFPGFAGHFPVQPVLPAIIQLAAVRHLAELALGRELLPLGCRRAKFREVVLPQEELSVSVSLVKKENNWQAQFSLRKGDSPVSGGGLLFKQV